MKADVAGRPPKRRRVRAENEKGWGVGVDVSSRAGLP